MILSDDVEDLWAVCEQALNDLQHIMSKVGHTEVVNEHLQPFLSGKLTAVLPIASNHGSQKLIQFMMDSTNVWLANAPLGNFNDNI